MNFSLLFAAVFSLPAFGFSSPPAQAPASFTHLVAFGDRFSGVGDCADAADAELGVRCPGPAFDYEDGHFTDGTASAPVSGKYAGAWYEQPAYFPAFPRRRPALAAAPTMPPTALSPQRAPAGAASAPVFGVAS